MSVVVEDEGVLAEIRAFNAELERTLCEATPMETVPVEKVRQARREGEDVFPPPEYLGDRARDLSISGRGGDVGLRVIAPEGREAVGAYVHIHGGGWVLGAADLQDPALAELADATGLAVVSVEYRLAPEHPYPAGPDDCEDAAMWLLQGGFAELGVPPVAAIGGDSAGANLAALTLLRLRDRHGISGAFSAANMIYGVFDLSLTPSARRWGPRPLLLNTPIMEHFCALYVPGMDEEARRDPDVSPLYADLSDMPPALFSVGTLDPLYDDTLFMEARWRAAGGPTELVVHREAIHGYNMFPLRLAAASRAQQYAFLNAALSG
jgi:acetyl esterase